MSIRILILALCMIQTTSLFAKTDADIVKASPFTTERFAIPAWNEKEVIAKMKASETQRKPSSSSMIDETMMSEKLRTIKKRFFALKTSEEMDSFLNELDKNYEAYPVDVKFYITQIAPIKAFRGIAYRLRSLFKGKSNFIHSEVLTTMKNLATQVKVFLPYDHAEIAYQYISSPYLLDAGNVVLTFNEEADVQLWISNEVLPLVENAARRLEKLTLVEPIIWDQQMVFGPKSFTDGINRYKLIGEFEKNLALSASYSVIAGIAIQRAYSIQKAISLYKEIGSLYGFDGFGIFKSLEGVSAERVTKVMKKREFAATGTIMPDGKKWMSYAYEANKKSLNHLNVAWDLSSQERKNENLYVFNTGFINVNRSEIEENLHLLKRITFSSGPEALRSSVTGEVVEINYSKFFLSPPEDLKVFLPTGFNKGDEVSREITLDSGKKKTVKYRNYLEGSATQWDVTKYENYFPSVKNSNDVYRIVRVLSHVQGNWLSLR